MCVSTGTKAPPGFEVEYSLARIIRYRSQSRIVVANVVCRSMELTLVLGDICLRDDGILGVYGELLTTLSILLQDIYLSRTLVHQQ